MHTEAYMCFGELTLYKGKTATTLIYYHSGRREINMEWN